MGKAGNEAGLMAVEVLHAVWAHSTARGSDLLVLLALADWARLPDAMAWPSLAQLAARVRLSQRQTIRVIERLERRGELLVRRRHRHRNSYRVNLGRFRVENPARNVENSVENSVENFFDGDTGVTSWVTPVSPHIPLNPLEKASSSRAPSNAGAVATSLASKALPKGNGSGQRQAHLRIRRLSQATRGEKT
jgi:DNA-binding transcriptional MocR family regulator